MSEILNNQLAIMEGRVHCPVLGCEVIAKPSNDV